MEPRTAAASVGVGILLLAWLASAVSDPYPRVARRPLPPAESAQLDRLRSDVETQSARLRERLAAVAPPTTPSRNPFVFGSRNGAPRRPAPAAPRADAPLPVFEPVPAEPVLVLIGIAERGAGDTLVRTAIIAGEGDALHMVTTGEHVAGLYRVRTIGADAVELERLADTTIRRMHLK
jgi:hypothetical protein